MARIIWTEESLAWLKEIDQYVAQTSDAAAVSVLEGIISKVEMLCEHPRLGAQLVEYREREIREFLYGRYRIIYEFAEETDAVHILAVIHGAMDIDRMRF
jgi:addiction module RelE/StbE family toxin